MSPSGKPYVGQTYNERNRRKLFFSSRSYGGQKIDRAREKYGPENFTYTVLFKIETNDKDLLMKELNEKEDYYISKYDSIDNGYNILHGGCSAYHDYIYTEEMRKKMGETSSKAIVQYSLSGEFIKDWPSASEAGRILGIQSALISKCCLRQTKHCRDFIFRFVGDIVKEDEKNPVLNRTKNLKVIQIKDGRVVNSWKSIAKASQSLGIERHKLSNLLKKGSFDFDNSIITQDDN